MLQMYCEKNLLQHFKPAFSNLIVSELLGLQLSESPANVEHNISLPSYFPPQKSCKVGWTEREELYLQL